MFHTLRFRLTAGAGILMLTALLGAGLAAIGAQRTEDYLDVAVAAERRINHLSVLSSHIAGYGLLVLEAARRPEGGPALALETQAAQIEESLARLDAEYAAVVMGESTEGLDRQTATATRAMGVAQIGAAFREMRAALERYEDPLAQEAALTRASGVMGPAINGMIEEEYRLRSAAFDAIARLRQRLIAAAVGVAAFAVAAAALFLLVVLRPTLARLSAARQATGALARGDFALALPRTRDEFAPLFNETRLLAAGLEAERAAVDRDRERLNQIVAERTEELRVANERLAQVDADRQRFFADVSHELRTPLTVILSETELARRGGGDPSAGLGVIEARARRLMQRIEDLLRLARSATGRLELVRERIDLARVARDVAGDFRRRAAVLRVDLETCTDAPAVAEVDPDWTRQVVSALLDNAFRHAADGGRVRIAVTRQGGEAVLSVTDNGPGIADPAAAFARFERGGATGGFGIGLSFARWVVEEQGGRISAESPVSPAEALGEAPGLRVTLAFPGVDG